VKKPLKGAYGLTKEGIMKRQAITFALLTLFFTACSDRPEIPKLVEPKSFERQQFKQDVSSVDFSDPLVDILLVIDGSGSMGTHQQNVESNLDKFLDRLTQAQLDYHIGVTISGYLREVTWQFLYPDRLVKANSGLLHTNNAADKPPYFVTRTTPNLLDVLKGRVRVGVNNDAIETFFGPVLDAIEHYSNGHPYNAGFFRERAYFVPIFITDTADQTKVNGSLVNYLEADEFYKTLVDFKGKSSLIIPYSVHIPSAYQNTPPTGCYRDPDSKYQGIPVNLEDFVRIGGGEYYDICASDFGVQLAALADDLSKRVAAKFTLDVVPDPTTIVVYYGSQVLPNHPKDGWIYMPETNSLHFGSNVKPPHEGAQIRVEFTPANKFGK
jgi:hypothetical protein